MSQASNEQHTSLAEETSKHVALQFRRDAELENSEAHTELIFLLKNNCPTNTIMGESSDSYVIFFAHK